MENLTHDLESLRIEFPGWDGKLPSDANEWTHEEVWFYVGSGGYMRPSPKSSSGYGSASLPNETIQPSILNPFPESNSSAEHCNDSIIDVNGVGRYFFNVDKWQPSISEWELALNQLESKEEQVKCCRFVFERDRKLAVGSRLLQRYAVRKALGIENKDFSILRTKKNKPVLDFKGSPRVQSAMKAKGYTNFNINATHHGCIVAVAVEPTLVVGIDVMNEREFLGGTQTADELISSFEKDFSKVEMRYITKGGVEQTDEAKFARFCRAWTLKEAYIKAHGIGLGIELSTICFYQIKEGDDSLWGVYVNNVEPSPRWTFHIQKVDEKHVTCVARAPPQHCDEEFVNHLPFSQLSREQCEEGHSLPHTLFTEVTLPCLLSLQAAANLYRVRHSSFCLKNGVENNGTALMSLNFSSLSVSSHWHQRWIQWLFKPPPPPPQGSSDNDAEVKVYSISDIHTDYSKNMLWIESLPKYPPGSYLILAGDVSHDMKVIRVTLEILKSKFDEVFYTVGNHELWVTKSDAISVPDTSGSGVLSSDAFHSLDKLMNILELCDMLGVRTRPTIVNHAKLTALSNSTPVSVQRQVLIVPLLSWYHCDLFPASKRQPQDSSPINFGGGLCSSSTDNNIFNTKGVVYSDYEVNFDAQCKWPLFIGSMEVNQHTDSPKQCANSFNIAKLMSELNEQIFEQFGLFSLCSSFNLSGALSDTSSSIWEGSAYRNETGGKIRSLPRWLPTDIISYSHFIPDHRLFPGRRDLIHVMGSKALQYQVSKIKPNIHVFGHSHIRIHTKLPEYPLRVVGLQDKNSQAAAASGTPTVSTLRYSSSTCFVQSYLGKTLTEVSDLNVSRHLTQVWPPVSTHTT